MAAEQRQKREELKAQFEAQETAAREASSVAASDAAEEPTAATPRSAALLALADLQAATGNFERGFIGAGGAGDVFRAASLPSLPAAELAIKRITLVGAQGAAQLQAELDVLGRCRHPSLLPLLGYCLDKRAPCLVYPLCTGGNLEDRILLSPDARQRLASLGIADPRPLTITQRLRLVLDATHALAYLHAPADGKPRTLHRDVKPSNILIGADGEGYLSDVGLAKGAEEGVGPAPTHMTTAAIKGTPGFLDPLLMNGLKHSEVTDGFGIGITVLMCLTGLPALEILQKCRTMMRNPTNPDKWKSPAVTDDTAGKWPEDTKVALAELALGLAGEQYAEDRMSLSEAIEKLKELCASHPAKAAAAAPPPPPPPPPVRECIICEDAPREVRFHCGHAVCCQGCLPLVLAQAAPQCPTCREPLDGANAVAEQGEQVRTAPTFVAQDPAAARGGRGGRGRGRGRGRGG
jgi:interleukin-1 receptor-associated kinase 1